MVGRQVLPDGVRRTPAVKALHKFLPHRTDFNGEVRCSQVFLSFAAQG